LSGPERFCEGCTLAPHASAGVETTTNQSNFFYKIDFVTCWSRFRQAQPNGYGGTLRGTAYSTNGVFLKLENLVIERRPDWRSRVEGKK